MNEDHWDIFADEWNPDVTCRYCRKGGFSWGLTDKGWRLLTPTGIVHNCKSFKQNEFRKLNEDVSDV